VYPDAPIVDVVWREARGITSTSTTTSSPKKNEKTSLFHYSEKSRHIDRSNTSMKKNKEKKIYNSSDDVVQDMSSTVLRRERFIFDNGMVFVGIDAMVKLSLCIRQKTRMCLESARNLLVISLGCGESASSSIPSSRSSSTLIEPPVSLLVGGAGGSGLMSIVLEEIFRYIKPLASQLRSNPAEYFEKQDSINMNKGRSSLSSSFIGLQQTYEQFTTKVILSAVIVSDGEMIDLLDTYTSSSKASSGQQKVDEGNKISVRKRKSDGRYMLYNASKIQLQSTADFDRLIGLLLGRRSAMSRLAHTLLLQKKKHSDNSTALHLIESIDPWAAIDTATLQNGYQPSTTAASNSFTASSSSSGLFDQTPSTAISSDSMFISISACGGGVSKSKPTVDFNFVCPCGKNWNMPGECIK